MLNNTPSYPALLAAQQAWLSAFNNPSATQAAKAAAQAACKAALAQCVREAGLLAAG